MLLTTERKQRKQRRQWRYVVVGCGAALVALIIVIVYIVMSFSSSQADVVVMRINDEPVLYSNYQGRMQKARMEVYSYFEQKYGSKMGPDFWEQTFDGEKPAERLQQLTEESIIRTKVQWILAKKHGLLNDISQDSFTQMRKDENGNRNVKQQQNQVVFGVEQLSERDYEDYALSKAVIALKQKLQDSGDITITNEELQQLYESKKSSYLKQDSITVQMIVVNIGNSSMEITDSSMREAKATAEQALADLNKGKIFKEVAERTNPTGQVEEQQFTEETRRMDTNAYPILRDEALKLQKGEISGIIEMGSKLTIMQCISRISQGSYSFQQMESQLRLVLLDAKYQALVDQLCLEAVIEREEAVIKQIGLTS